MRVNVDTNACLRFLLDDIPEQVAQVESVIDSGNAFLSSEVLAECAFVLEHVYETTRQDAARGLKSLVEVMNCESSVVFNRAVDVFSMNRKLDIVDALVIARSLEPENSMLTFDKDMQKVFGSLATTCQ